MASFDVEEIIADAREHFIEGRYEIAEPMLQQALLRNSRLPEVYQMMATIHYDRGKFSKAIQAFKKALEIDPTYTDASVGLSIVLNDLGRYDEGREIFETAQKRLDEDQAYDDPYINEKLASKHEELGDLYFQYKRYKESLEQLYKAQKLSSRKQDIGLRIAECHLQDGKDQQAVKQLKELVRDYPQFLPARVKLGLIYYNSGHIAEAAEQWENVLIREPRHEEARKYLKMAQAAGITTLNL